ncbi:MAG: acylphosphatase [Phycisphaerales bacterium]|nr:acylphosphatase [Phycisphaerales bacterium]
MQRRAVIYAGRVQGVGFRATAAGLARGFAVTGWVRNEPDGTVRLEVQGGAGDVEALLRAIGERMRSNIGSSREHEMLPVSEEMGFEIRRG